MEIQEKAPNKSGNIDKNNNTHKDYNVKNREAFSSSDVVEILQKYKTALVKKLNKRVHLFWNQEENKIDWSEAQPPLYQNALPGDIELKKELLKMKDVIQFDDKQIAGIIVQYAGGVVCKVVEKWLSEITSREAQVLFYSFINHDYEKREKAKGYSTLSNREIGAKMNLSEAAIRKIKRRSLWKIMVSY